MTVISRRHAHDRLVQSLDAALLRTGFALDAAAGQAHLLLHYDDSVSAESRWARLCALEHQLASILAELRAPGDGSVHD